MGHIFFTPQVYPKSSPMSSTNMTDFAQALWLDIPNVAKYFSFRRKKTLSLIHQKKVLASKDGKAWVVSVASLKKYINKHVNIKGGQE